MLVGLCDLRFRFSSFRSLAPTQSLDATKTMIYNPEVVSRGLMALAHVETATVSWHVAQREVQKAKLFTEPLYDLAIDSVCERMYCPVV